MTASSPDGGCRACRALREGVRALVISLLDRILARPGMAKVNAALMTVALRGLGYNHCCEPKKTGEAKLVGLAASGQATFCIDIGANNGAYTRELLRQTNAHVLAFEPLPGAFRQLESIASEHPGRVTAVNCGVADQSGELQLRFDSDDSELATFSDKVAAIPYVAAAQTRTKNVPVVSLDDYLFAADRAQPTTHIDLLKIDVEGFEYQVLQGAQRTIRELRPRIVQIEYNWHQLFTGHSLYELAQMLSDYDAFQLLPFGSGLRPIDVSAPQSNIYSYANFAFIRRDLSA